MNLKQMHGVVFFKQHTEFAYSLLLTPAICMDYIDIINPPISAVFQG